MSDAELPDARIEALAQELRALKAKLGAEYWDSDAVRALQGALRREIGSLGGWSEGGLPTHQRARHAARLESECAALLWPGRSDN